MGKAHIPFNKVDIQGNEFEYIKDATASSHKSGDGIFSHKCNSLLEKELDENKLEGLITEKTKAIIPVHYAGVSCEMDIVMNIANKYDIPVIEDNAHGLFGKYKDRYLGTFGTFSTQSFHETKNYSCGEGGALLPFYTNLSKEDQDYILNELKLFV
jgi:dTDP-4-amino-4,6-dideoxygalactose transaminase